MTTAKAPETEMLAEQDAVLRELHLLKEERDSARAARERANTSSQFWRLIAACAISVIITLCGAWVTHGVSRDDLTSAIDTNNKLNAARVELLNQQIEQLSPLPAKIEQLQKEIEYLRTTIDDMNGTPTVHHHPNRGD